LVRRGARRRGRGLACGAALDDRIRRVRGLELGERDQQVGADVGGAGLLGDQRALAEMAARSGQVADIDVDDRELAERDPGGPRSPASRQRG